MDSNTLVKYESLQKSPQLLGKESLLYALSEIKNPKEIERIILEEAKKYNFIYELQSGYEASMSQRLVVTARATASEILEKIKLVSSNKGYSVTSILQNNISSELSFYLSVTNDSVEINNSKLFHAVNSFCFSNFGKFSELRNTSAYRSYNFIYTHFVKAWLYYLLMTSNSYIKAAFISKYYGQREAHLTFNSLTLGNCGLASVSLLSFNNKYNLDIIAEAVYKLMEEERRAMLVGSDREGGAIHDLFKKMEETGKFNLTYSHTVLNRNSYNNILTMTLSEK